MSCHSAQTSNCAYVSVCFSRGKQEGVPEKKHSNVPVDVQMGIKSIFLQSPPSSHTGDVYSELLPRKCSALVMGGGCCLLDFIFIKAPGPNSPSQASHPVCCPPQEVSELSDRVWVKANLPLKAASANTATAGQSPMCYFLISPQEPPRTPGSWVADQLTIK